MTLDELMAYYKAQGRFNTARAGRLQEALGAPAERGFRGTSPMEWAFRKMMEPEQLTGVLRPADFLAPQAAAMSDIAELEYALQQPGLETSDRALLRGAEGLTALGALPLVGLGVKPLKMTAKMKAMAAKFPTLGEGFGPRGGFYSKLERAILEMPQPMKPAEFQKYLKGKGISKAELETYDVETLLRYADQNKTIKPDEFAEWTLRRRPDYTETRKAGTEQSWRAATEDTEIDQDAFDEWRRNETDRLMENVEGGPYVDDTDEDVWRVMSEDGWELERFDSEEAADRYLTAATDEFYDTRRQYYDEMTDDGFVRTVNRGYSARELAEEEGWVLGSPEENPRFFGDPGDDPDSPMYAEARGKWGTSHYSPARENRSFDQDYVEMIQQMPPIARSRAAALQQEIQSGGASVDTRGLPLFDNAPDSGAWRERELARYNPEAQKDWFWNTHWEEPNPFQHIRGYYNAPEATIEERVVRPGTGVARPPIESAEQALQEGYTYRLTTRPPPPGGTEASLVAEFLSPEGLQMERFDPALRAPMLPGGRGLAWDDEAGAVWNPESFHRIDPMRRDRYLENWANTRLETLARAERVQQNELTKPLIRKETVPTGRKGFLASEIQADPEQQGRGEYLQVQQPLPPTREELRAQGYDVRSVPWNELGGEHSLDFTYDEIPGRHIDLARMTATPEWRQYAAQLPASTYRALNANMARIIEGGARADAGRMGTLYEAAVSAGVPEDVIPPWLTITPPSRYRGGRVTTADISVPSDIDENSWNAAGLTGWEGGGDSYRLPLQEQPATLQAPRFSAMTAGVETEEEAWDDLIEEMTRQLRPTRGDVPQYPLVDDSYQLSMKRALLEAAHTDQDFVAWNSPRTMLLMNNPSMQSGHPEFYSRLTAGGYDEALSSPQATEALMATDPHFRKALSGDYKLNLGGLAPRLYSEQGYLGTGPTVRALGLKGKVEPVTMAMPDPYNPGAEQLKGFKIDLDEKTRQRIRDEGFSLWQMLPYLAVPAGYGMLDFWQEPNRETY